jgi:hypothetical protein
MYNSTWCVYCRSQYRPTTTVGLLRRGIEGLHYRALILLINKLDNMKPIHKLNNGRGATLCHTCSVIITTGLTEDLYCEKCKPKQETTLEEAYNKIYKSIDFTEFDFASFAIGAKWQQEEIKDVYLNGYVDGLKDQAKLRYNDEEVFNLLCKMPNYFKMTIPQQIKARYEWFEQFKKK